MLQRSAAPLPANFRGPGRQAWCIQRPSLGPDTSASLTRASSTASTQTRPLLASTVAAPLVVAACVAARAASAASLASARRSTRRSRMLSFSSGARAARREEVQGSVVASEDVEVVPGSEALKVAGDVMSLLRPLFVAEAQLQAMSYDRTEIQEQLRKDVTSAPVVIYTYSLSPFSTEATKLLDSVGAQYKEIVLAPEWFMMLGEGAAKRAELARLFGRSSMPHIFFGGRSIGGFTDGSPGLLALHESGELEAALKQVGGLPEDNPFGFFLFSGDNPKQRCYGTDICEVLE